MTEKFDIIYEQTLFEIECEKTESRLDEGFGDVVKDATKFALDIVGFIPGAGEIADGANALWYISEGQYFYAALSIISMIPEVISDAGAKGVKWLSMLFGKNFGKLLKNSSFMQSIKKAWDKVAIILGKSENLKKIIPDSIVKKMDKAVDDFLNGVKSGDVAADDGEEREDQKEPNSSRFKNLAKNLVAGIKDSIAQLKDQDKNDLAKDYGVRFQQQKATA